MTETLKTETLKDEFFLKTIANDIGRYFPEEECRPKRRLSFLERILKETEPPASEEKTPRTAVSAMEKRGSAETKTKTAPRTSLKPDEKVPFGERLMFYFGSGRDAEAAEEIKRKVLEDSDPSYDIARDIGYGELSRIVYMAMRREAVHSLPYLFAVMNEKDASVHLRNLMASFPPKEIERLTEAAEKALSDEKISKDSTRKRRVETLIDAGRRAVYEKYAKNH